MEREMNGLFEAMDFFDLKLGLLVTLHQTDEFEKDGKVIKVITAAEFLSA